MASAIQPVPSTFWASPRKETLDWLRRIPAPSLAELYESAVEMLEGLRPGYVRLVSHAVREIANRLPRVLDEDYVGGHLDYPKRLQQIRDTWPALPEFGAASPSLSSGSLVASSVVTLWRSLLEEDLNTTKRVRRTAIGLFIAAEVRRSGRKLSPTDVEPAVDEWIRTVRWFQGWVHEDDNQRPVDLTDFTEHFGAFERALCGLYQEHFPARGDLDEILAKTNA